MGEAPPQGIVRNEEHASLDLRARDRLGDIVQQADDAEPAVPLLAKLGADLPLRELRLYGPYGLEGVLEGVEVVVRTLPLVSGEPELRYLTQQRARVERVFQDLVYRGVGCLLLQCRRRLRIAFLRLVFGL